VGSSQLVQILPSIETNLALATRVERWSRKQVENKAQFVWRSLQVSAMGVDSCYHISKGFLHSLCQVSAATTVLTPATYSFGSGARIEETDDPLIQTGEPFGRVNCAKFFVTRRRFMNA
jgi:hypothetical protein